MSEDLCIHDLPPGSCTICLHGVDPFETANCTSCQALIIWTTTKNGKNMPVDAQPVDDGNVALSRTPSGKVYSRVVQRGPNLRTSHFQNCPDAALYRHR